MNLGVLIGTAIGVLMVWIMLAAITSQVQEWVSQWRAWRPQMLEEAIRNILASDDLTTDFYEHPLIKSLHNKKGSRKPSQIPNRQFASVLFDMFINAGTEESAGYDVKTALEKLRTNITNLRNNPNENLSHLAKAVDTILVDVSMDVDKADKSIAEARQRIETWYGDAMDRLSGAYKRKIYVWTILIGIFIAAVLNADSLAIANTLWKEPLVRDALIAQAEQLKLQDLGLPTDSQPGVDAQQGAAQNIENLRSLPIPLGWTPENMPKPGDWNGWLMKVGGIVVSGIAAAQGAPFWFEIMKKLLNLRSSSGVLAKKEEEET